MHLTEDQTVDLCKARNLEHPRKRHRWLVAAVATIDAAKQGALEDAGGIADLHPDVVSARLNANVTAEGLANCTDRLGEAKATAPKAEELDPDSPEGSPEAAALAAITGAEAVARDTADLAANQRLSEGYAAHLTFLRSHHLAELVSKADLGARAELARAHAEALSEDWTPETPPFETAAHA